MKLDIGGRATNRIPQCYKVASNRSEAARDIRTILKYHSRYLCQIPLETMVLPVQIQCNSYNTTASASLVYYRPIPEAFVCCCLCVSRVFPERLAKQLTPASIKNCQNMDFYSGSFFLFIAFI